MNLSLFLITLLVSSCANSPANSRLKNSSTLFEFQDQTGIYILKRDVKITKSTLAVRAQLFGGKEMSKSLESSVTVSKIGMRSNKKKILRPEASQYSIWLEKERFYSEMKTDKTTKSVNIKLKSPDKNWNGQSSKSFRDAKYYCYFSQLPECLKIHGLLVPEKKEKVYIQILWDSYPYYVDQYEGVQGNLFSRGEFYLYDVKKDELKYALNIGNQVIFYHFNMDLEFIKMFWIIQGITIQKRTSFRK